jgi:Cof subfamily protein (haloacid dehalogenase superfamily)
MTAARRSPSPGPYRLLAVDVDGTLVDRSLEIRPRNLAALRGLVGRGVKVVLATGRMFSSALPYAEAIGTEEPIICYQGAVVRSRDGELLVEYSVSPEHARRAVELSRANDLHVNLYHDDRFYVERMDSGARRYAEVSRMTPNQVPDLMEIAGGGSTKVVFVDDPERLRALEPEIRRTFEPDCRVTFSLPEFLEVVNALADKGRALAFVCERNGIAPEEVVAAGDAPNDVEMLRFAGLAVAPSNAFPEALAEADEVIPPPENDGIAVLVERFFQSR